MKLDFWRGQGLLNHSFTLWIHQSEWWMLYVTEVGGYLRLRGRPVLRWGAFR